MSTDLSSPDLVLTKIQQLQKQVSLLSDAIITQDTRGHSKALCLVVQPQASARPAYFTKIYPEDRQAQLLKIESTYRQLKIPTAKIIDITYLPSINETVCSHQYLAGPTLKEILPISTVEEYENLGYQVGAELSKFAQVQGDPQKFQQDFDAELAQLWDNVYQKKREYNQTHIQKLPIVNLHRLEKSFNYLKTFVYATTPVFVHSDINLNNIIIHRGKPYFIDTDGGGIKFRALDFRGNCWWGWTGNNVEKERAVYRGIYRGLFTDQIPKSFHQELAFTMIYEFILRVYKYRNDPEQIHYSFLRWHDILTLTRYFENYTFDWF